MPTVPLPGDDFKAFAEHQKRLLFEETESFFKRHGLTLKKYILPVPLPEWANSLDEVLDTGVEHEPYSTIYRHQHFLKARILHNWSYIETQWNVAADPRNENIPFDLRPLTKEIVKQLDSTNADILDPEFSGLLVTVNTGPFVEEIDIASTNAPPHKDGTKNRNGTTADSAGSGKSHNTVTKPETKVESNGVAGVTAASADANETSGKRPVVKSKIIAGALVECLMTNERCIRCIWLHPKLSKHSSRILLQSFLPRLMLEMFNVPSVMTDKGPSTYHKFAYAMHNDLDMFPRQCWLLLASIKKMSLPRHYEPSTFEEHPVDLEYGECHMDEAGHLLLNEFSGIVDDGILLSVGTECSVRSVSCNCYTEKLKKSMDAQAWLDRLVGCTESYMCIMLPKRAERESLGLYVRDGWRDLITDALDRPLQEELMELLPLSARSQCSHAYDPSVATVTVRCDANLNSDLEEWCKLRRDDLIDVTSDTEAYMQVEVDEDEYSLRNNSKRSRSRI
ncbi:hypothetical protein BgAZ_201490 [Babesia gibsoni]|uniref:Uncharacterized protein n=1 Tax=Babesia gibsoni TaxID=33632 RepID=A0AAD8LPF7_BABGI|nr:hypothetical protein BgAZ_201490 [Babesia gibsoni]